MLSGIYPICKQEKHLAGKNKTIVFPLCVSKQFNVNKMLLSKRLIFTVPCAGSEVKKKKLITKASKQCKQH